MNMHIRTETWDLRRPFRISGMEITACPLLIVEIEADGHVGRGEATGVSYHGETAESMLLAARAFAQSAPKDLNREMLQELLPPGGVRNAFDCALWELDALRANTSVWRLAGITKPKPLLTTFTIGADAPDDMADQAIELIHAHAIKLKLTGDAAIDIKRVTRVREARPDVWLAVDANRGYTISEFSKIKSTLADCDVRQVEQPLAMDRDSDMPLINGAFDTVADESAQDIRDLPALVGRFTTVNIKLDKTGGLTHAISMAKKAKELGLKVMVGNMVGTSWSQAAGFIVGQHCDVVDLDGAHFLVSDRKPGMVYKDGKVWCGDDVWGGGAKNVSGIGQ